MRCAGVERGECALKAREEAWRHAGSTRNEGPEEVQASAADLPLDGKRCHSPLLPHILRRDEEGQILASSISSSAMIPAWLRMLAEGLAVAVSPGPAGARRRTATHKIQIAAGSGERQSAHGAAKGRRACGGR